ncbi:MAG TPA: FHA domain-containing protein [Aggregatilineales bacterium]|nr:FHA domain-containing protein [Anaerolineales bacterium]HRE46240.1 FHA domain-containing protein [Aggregatilineales bacterium]
MQGSGSFRLIVRRGPQPNQVYELSKDVSTLGRDITNDIVINDPEVSRHHCRLTRGGGGYTMEDLGSTNGTFVNGQRLMGARPLAQGDQIGLGETVTLAYEAAFAPADFPRAAASQQPPPYQPVQSGQLPPAPQQPMQPPAPTLQMPQAPQGMGQMPPAQANYPGAPAQQMGGGYQPAPPGYAQQPYGYEPALSQNPGLGRWFFIGCGCLIVLCVVVTVIAAIYIDTNDLYCSIPLLRDVVGIIRRCP